MAAGQLNFTIEQGTTFQRKITLKDSLNVPIDLTGRTFRGKIKLVAGDGATAADLTFSLLNQLTNPGEVYMSLTDAQTSAIPVDEQSSAEKVSKDYAYDIEMIVSGEVERILEGVISVSPEVTK